MAKLLEQETLRQAETGAAPPQLDSLVRQAARAEGRSARGRGGTAPENGSADHASVPLADGYLRRSPVQPVRVSVDYYRRRIRRIIGLIILAAALIALVRILIGAGILAF
ncbi:hypothetical protein [Oscillibacter sp.]|uniref:hypothetical protein n=1 Tax=Oscillibacter sp. TaxID=1945593 RepID=UPI003392DB8F